MTTPQAADPIAFVAEHIPDTNLCDDYEWLCSCGAEGVTPEDGPSSAQLWAAHLVAALQQRWAFTALTPGEHELGVGWSFGDGPNATFVSDGDTLVYDQEAGHTPAQARVIASWWLTAARTAEQGRFGEDQSAVNRLDQPSSP